MSDVRSFIVGILLSRARPSRPNSESGTSKRLTYPRRQLRARRVEWLLREPRSSPRVLRPRSAYGLRAVVSIPRKRCYIDRPNPPSFFRKPTLDPGFERGPRRSSPFNRPPIASRSFSLYGLLGRSRIGETRRIESNQSPDDELIRAPDYFGQRRARDPAARTTTPAESLFASESPRASFDSGARAWARAGRTRANAKRNRRSDTTSPPTIQRAKSGNLKPARRG